MTALCSMPPTRAKAEALIDWYAQHARDLPWRHLHDPYAIWISEIMLQQTQVGTVLPRYAAWMRHFPDIATLASATSDDVMKAWEGLGYYRRARMLHQAAHIVADQYQGRFPQAFADIHALPGIGRSTAGAIASFCFGTADPVLDGNVRRVLCRWYGQQAATDKQLWAWAAAEISVQADPAMWNQAMMEIGALVCQPRQPDCAACPVRDFCASAFRQTDATAKPRPAIRSVHWRVHLHLDGHKGIWLTRRPTPGIWAGLWSPPISELDAAPAEEPAHIHQLTHRRLHLYASASGIPPEGEGQWFHRLGEVALPTGIRRLLTKQGVCL